uniref:RNase H type-1 domain-containing protein n=1 Tax=Triticum urartu TaxID=4572 RepID=A0A8R7UGP7_TRIUA
AAAAPKAKRKTGGWELPPRGHVKLNVDASFDGDLLVGTAGAIIRDDRGNFIDAGNWKLDFCYDVLSAEATALRYGLSLAQTVGCNKVIIKSDNLEVVNTINEGGRSAGPATTIFDDCYHM